MIVDVHFKSGLKWPISIDTFINFLAEENYLGICTIDSALLEVETLSPELAIAITRIQEFMPEFGVRLLATR